MPVRHAQPTQHCMPNLPFTTHWVTGMFALIPGLHTFTSIDDQEKRIVAQAHFAHR